MPPDTCAYQVVRSVIFVGIFCEHTKWMIPKCGIVFIITECFLLFNFLFEKNNWKIIGKVSISRSLTTNVRLNENVGIIKIYYSSDNKEPISDVSRLFEGPVYRFGCPKDIFQVSFFQLYFNKKHVKVAINDFTMHLIILEWLGMEKQMQTEEKNNGINNHQRERRNCLRKCFHSFKHVIIDHANVRFFFLISLWTCSHSLNEINSLHYFMCFLLYYLLHLNHADGCFVM